MSARTAGYATAPASPWADSLDMLEKGGEMAAFAEGSMRNGFVRKVFGACLWGYPTA